MSSKWHLGGGGSDTQVLYYTGSIGIPTLPNKARMYTATCLEVAVHVLNTMQFYNALSV